MKKEFLFILMAVFTISAFGSFTIPDDDVGDPVTISDVSDIDVLNIQSVDVATVDAESANTFWVDAGTLGPRMAIKPPFMSKTITHKPNDDVGWYDRPWTESEQPPSQRQNGTSGGNPGWH